MASGDSNEYNACISIMMQIDLDQLAEIKSEFSTEEDGLSLHQFVDVMLGHLHPTENSTASSAEDYDATVIPLVRDLTELFAQVDVNGDASMEWEEFTGFLIKVGMGGESSNGTPSLLQHELSSNKYIDDERYEDDELHHPRKVQYIPALRKVFVFENERPIIQVYDPTSFFTGYPFDERELPLVHEIHPMCNTVGYQRQQTSSSATAKSGQCVQAAIYLQGLDIIAVAPGDTSISFWSYSATAAHDFPPSLVTVPTSSTQRALAWCPDSKQLYSIGIGKQILPWSVKGNSKNCQVIPKRPMVKHRDTIQDIVMVSPTVLASCGLDGLVILWDCDSNDYKGKRIGHTRGVQSITRCTDTLFVTGGYDFDILGWDSTGVGTTPVFKLLGHTSPVIQLESIPNSPHIISLDEAGWFRWWDVSQGVPIEDSERQIQTFHLIEENGIWAPHSFSVMDNGNSIVAAKNRLKLVRRLKIKPKSVASVVAIYNSVSFTIVTTSARNVRIWDACTGKLLREYFNISSSEITQIDLDDRQRKFVLGNQAGEILVFDYLSGAMIKSFPSHHSEVSCVIYCVEDNCVLTSSWDRSIRVYDDDSESPLVRCLYNAHQSDISTLAFSYPLCLVASACTDGSIKVWDFIYIVKEGDCQVANNNSNSPATALAFFDPYPLLLSAHEDGSICMWSTRPWCNQPSCTLLYRVRSAAQGDVPITCMQTYYDATGGEEIAEGVTTGQHLVLTGDESGFVCIYNITSALQKMEMTAVPEHKLPHTSRSYNPKRNIVRDENSNKTASKSRNDTPVFDLKDEVVVQHSWDGHAVAIKSIRIAEVGPCLLTSSRDKTVVAWSLSGEKLGVLSTSSDTPMWNIEVDTRPSALAAIENAKKLYAEIIEMRKQKKEEDKRLSLMKQQKLDMLDNSLKRSATTPDLNSNNNTEREGQARIFQQLEGKVSWKRSAYEEAEAAALVQAKKDYKERMESILRSSKGYKKKKALRKDTKTNDDPLADKKEADFDLTTFPEMKGVKTTELPFDHKDNWNIDGRNRQKVLYSNLYGELKRGKRTNPSKGTELREIDVTPSKFLLDQLGPVTAVEKKRAKSLRQSHSVPTLSKRKQKKPPHRVLPIQETRKVDERSEEDQEVIRESSDNQGRPKPRQNGPGRYSQLVQQELRAKTPASSNSTSKRKSTKKSTRKPLVSKSNKSSAAAAASSVSKKGTTKKTTNASVRSDVKIMNQSHFGAYSREEVLEVVRLFESIDNDHSGSIELEEFVNEAMLLKSSWMRDNVVSIFQSLDRDKSGEIDITELFKVLFPNANVINLQDMTAFSELVRNVEAGVVKKKRVLSPAEVRDIKALFHLYDADGSGSVDVQELVAAIGENDKIYGRKAGSSSSSGASGSSKTDGMSLGDLKDVISTYDTDGDQVLDIKEFIELFRDVF